MQIWTSCAPGFTNATSVIIKFNYQVSIAIFQCHLAVLLESRLRVSFYVCLEPSRFQRESVWRACSPERQFSQVRCFDCIFNESERNCSPCSQPPFKPGTEARKRSSSTDHRWHELNIQHPHVRALPLHSFTLSLIAMLSVAIVSEEIPSDELPDSRERTNVLPQMPAATSACPA